MCRIRPRLHNMDGRRGRHRPSAEDIAKILASEEYGVHISPRVIQMDMAAIRSNKEVGSTKKKRAVVRAVNRGNKLGVRGGKPVKGGKG